jgi:hypothetical protein
VRSREYNRGKPHLEDAGFLKALEILKAADISCAHCNPHDTVIDNM